MMNSAEAQLPGGGEAGGGGHFRRADDSSADHWRRAGYDGYAAKDHGRK